MVRTGRLRLAELQLDDGRIPLDPQVAAAYWPTALAVLAWLDGDSVRRERSLATSFLLDHGGVTYNLNQSINKLDPSLEGWTWSEGCFSWVEPTSMSMFALRSQGLRSHPRYRQGIALLLDRMLADGGWNYGNKKIFGDTLLPFPDCTGMALTALCGEVNGKKVKKSLDYLETVYPRVTTPLSLAWVIQGLGAWGRRPADWAGRIESCLALQRRYGPFSTALLAQLSLACLDRPLGVLHDG